MIYCMRTRIFFSVNNTDYLLVPNYRISITRNIADGHGFSFFFSCPELENYRIFVFTRNIADSHGFSFLSRIIELSNFIFFVPRLVLGPTDRREVIIEFSSSMILRDIPCDYKKIRKFSNS